MLLEHSQNQQKFILIAYQIPKSSFLQMVRESNFLCKLLGKAVKIIWTVVDVVWPVTGFFSSPISSNLRWIFKKKKKSSNFQETFMANEAQLITNVVNPRGSFYVRMFYCWIFSITFSQKKKRKKKKGLFSITTLLNKNLKLKKKFEKNIYIYNSNMYIYLLFFKLLNL